MQVPTILIVEDDVPTQSLFAAVARRISARPICVVDGEQAIAAIQRQRPAAILLDLVMPRLNGFEVLRYLKHTVPDLLASTVVVTAASDQALHQCVELADVCKVLRKPVDLETVTAELRLCVDTSRKNAIAASAANGSQPLVS